MKRKYSNKYLGKYAEKKKLQSVKEQCEKAKKKLPKHLAEALYVAAAIKFKYGDYNEGVK